MGYKFFSDDGFNFDIESLLGNVHCGCGDVGEILSTVEVIKDGDFQSWVSSWTATALRLEKIAAASAAAGHRQSARDAYLRATTYYGAALSAVDGVDNSDAVLATTFKAHRRTFDEYVDLLDTPVERVAISYENTMMPGYFFSAGSDATPRATLVLSNGSDGPLIWMWPGIGLDAVARGYNVLAFDGPGQQSMLFDHDIPFRPDWEKVITPVVDFLVARPDVDADRLAIYGISQSGYWVPRAIAFEHRFAAAIADPGVDDVSSSWLLHIPAEMAKMLDDNDRDGFMNMIAIGTASETPQQKQLMAWRGKPYGITDPYDLFKEAEKYRLGDVTAQITTPVFVASPENEQFWPGQSERFYKALPGKNKTLSEFTEADGADGHCEPMARTLFKQRAFDWLDDIVKP
jgi:Prolyl oligopeptidase family